MDAEEKTGGRTGPGTAFTVNQSERSEIEKNHYMKGGQI